MMSESLAESESESGTNPVVTKDAPHTPTLPTVYLTDGELLPLKGYWFKVRLREIDGEKLVTLEKTKPTASLVKRSQRTAHWLKQHPRSSQAQYQKLGTIAKFLLRSSQASQSAAR